MSRVPPAVVLFLLAPAIGELLSGSAPPAEFFTPLGLTILLLLYGGGAVVARELKVRWGKGVPSLVLLGAAYGIIEEGVMVASFFNPNWQDLGMLGVYGRWSSVNWVWAEMLTIYHAVFSIVIPILLVELAYPDSRSVCWLGNRAFRRVLMAFAAVVGLGFVLFGAGQNYWPPPPQYLLSILAAGGFIYAAYQLDPEWGRGKRRLPRPLALWALGLIGTVVFYLGIFLLPGVLPEPAMGVLFAPLLAAFFVFVFTRFDWSGHPDRWVMALVAGALSFFIFLAPLQELDSSRTDNTTGMGLVGLFSLVALLLLRRKVWSSEADLSQADPSLPHNV